jgi:hypothetical protein
MHKLVVEIDRGMLHLDLALTALHEGLFKEAAENFHIADHFEAEFIVRRKGG